MLDNILRLLFGIERPSKKWKEVGKHILSSETDNDMNNQQLEKVMVYTEITDLSTSYMVHNYKTNKREVIEKMQNKIVDGVELLRMMKNDELRDKDVYVTIHKDYIISSEEQRVKLQFSVDNRIALDEDFEDLLNINDLINMEFEIISKEDEEIDIEAIEEFEFGEIEDETNYETRNKINKLIKAVKQLDERIKTGVSEEDE